jgi:ribonuclease HII
VKFRVELSSAQMIDEKGIVPAVNAALEKGLRDLLPSSVNASGEVQSGAQGEVQAKVFLDGALRAPSEYVQETVIGGDGIIPVIMLASVAAKVVRDRFMVREIALRFPAYNFEKHKGYGTATHYAAITEHGLCPEHRRSFLKRII